MTVLDYCEEG